MILSKKTIKPTDELKLLVICTSHEDEQQEEMGEDENG